MTFLLQSQVSITPTALAKIVAEKPTFEEGMIEGLNWSKRSYQTDPDGTISNEVFNHFVWGGFWLKDFPVESIWEFGDWRMYIQDGRWKDTDKLKLSIKDGALSLDMA